jgi:undecaprenyl-diphosphatase
MLVSLCAFALLAIVTGDVVEAQRTDIVPMLDHAFRPVAQASAQLPGVRTVASTLSWLTGEGLPVVLLAAGIVLHFRRRRRETAVIVLGTLSAWGASGIFKLVAAVPRPRSAHWQYGFPSGHAFVTLVALGLIAWVAGRRTSTTRRAGLMIGAVGAAVLTGCARLVLDAHWLSDVVAGLAVGTVWLNATIALAERSSAPNRSVPAR